MTHADRPSRAALAAVLALLATAPLAGCMTDHTPGPKVSDAVTPLDQYPLEAARHPEELALATHAEGLSYPQRDALAGFVQHWRGSGEPIVVRAPANCPDSLLAARTADEVMNALQAMGVPAAALSLVGYDNGGRSGAPVLAGFQRFAAIVPHCADKWDNLSSTGGNDAYRTFGCAETANMATMIADPRDIVGPRPEQAPDAERREFVLGRYRQGLKTAAEREPQASVDLSVAIKP